METQERDWVEGQVQRYRQEMEAVVAKRRSGQIKTLSDMEEEVSRVNQRMGQQLLEEMLALKKTTRRKER
jgi:hypothetical protein